MNILGINESHCASAALLKDGLILACAQEERFTRIKNQAGFPKNAIEFCLRQTSISWDDIDLIVYGAKNPAAAIWLRTSQKPLARFFNNLTATTSDLTALIGRFFPWLFYFNQSIYAIFYAVYLLIRPVINFAHRKSGFKKTLYLDHHFAHAFAANYIFGQTQSTRLVITNDGAGDGVCGRVFKVRGKRWREIAQTPNKYSLGYLYYYVTELLGFTPDEEEYKVMGLSPYADAKRADRVYRIFKNLIWVDGLSFKAKLNRVSFRSFLKAFLSDKRFDDIAYGIQTLTEELVSEQVENAIKQTGIKQLILGGGLAANIKANLQVSKIPALKNLWVCPSPSDESVAIGACFWGYKMLCLKAGVKFNPQPVKNLYLGPEFNAQDIEKVIREIKGDRGYRVRKIHQSKIAQVVARLLSQGQVVARFSGRMEFGARALGNRSILADPRDVRIVKIINDSIKQRDFWMPFAPTILDEDADKYLINPKKIDSPFMMIGFETTPRAQKEIPATLHPYDQTCRPQILKREDNPAYYDIIREFKKLTGVGAILNTSFNLHGEPIVCTPEDAIRTFRKSDLKHLLLEDYLISQVS